MRRRAEGDEELAVAAVRAARARHAERAAFKRLIGEFRLDLLAAAAHAVAVRAAGLGHEALDHAVENQAVIVTFTDQLLDARDVLRGEIRAEPDGHAARFQVEIGGVFFGSVFFVCHNALPLNSLQIYT